MHTFIFKVSSLMLGRAYPAYASYQCINLDIGDYCNWQIYWIVFSIFMCAESVADLLLCWLPFYYELKFFFIIWLLPTFGSGCLKVHRDYLMPFVEDNRDVIEEILHKFGFCSKCVRGYEYELASSNDEAYTEADFFDGDILIENFQRIVDDPLAQLDLLMYTRSGRTFDGFCAANKDITQTITNDLQNQKTNDAEAVETIELFIRRRPDSVVVPAGSDTEE